MATIKAIYKKNGKKYDIEELELLSPFDGKFHKYYKVCGADMPEYLFKEKFKICKEEIESDDMLAIADLLREVTLPFKENLITETRSWATGQVDENCKMRDRYFALPKTQEWAGSYNSTYQQILGEIEGRSLANKMSRFVSDLTNFDKSIFVQKEVRKINAAFETDIKKLASRMSEKNMKLENLKVYDLKVLAGSLDLWITDGDITFHARTILANGKKLQPHYRFITKNIKAENLLIAQSKSI